MGVTLQAGFLASCVVFGPMAMAGWHLTRNRVLFFSGSLFIMLAVSVHVFPYFPVLDLTFSAVPSAQASVGKASPASLNLTSRDDCKFKLHRVRFSEYSKPHHIPSKEAGRSNYTDWDNWDWMWGQENLDDCGFQKLNREESLELLQGTWIVIAGDSQARLLFVALLELVLSSIEDLRPQLFKRHSNFEYSLKSHHMLLEFVWAPYSGNLTQMAVEYHHNQKFPDVLVMGAGLWHMLHSGNHTHYGSSLVKLTRTLRNPKLHADNDPSTEEVFTPQLFWMSLPTLVPSLLQSDLKRERMTTEKLNLYTMELRKIDSLLRPNGPATLLDIQDWSSHCGPHCTQDGIHYSQAVYRAALHVMINHLLIVTKQTPID